ncbi:MAG: FecR domain-containing protein [Candidatus Wallbacteria bacterium]|nr:FecR domain-containing protein [Candidatus Wallbacteria bacterium]
MLKGVLWARAKKDDDSLKVATPNAICGVRGTEFLIDLSGDEMNLMVAEGAVAFVPLIKGLTPRATLVEAGRAFSFNARKMTAELEKAAKNIGDKLKQSGLGPGGKIDFSNLLDLSKQGQNIGQELEKLGNKLSEGLETGVSGLADYADQMASGMAGELFKQVLGQSMVQGVLEPLTEKSFSSSGIVVRDVSEHMDKIGKGFETGNFDTWKYFQKGKKVPEKPQAKPKGKSGEKSGNKKTGQDDSNQWVKDVLKKGGF